MGLFNSLGRKAEEFKQSVDAAKADEATHECPDCETLLYTANESCPDCGSNEIEER